MKSESKTESLLQTRRRTGTDSKEDPKRDNLNDSTLHKKFSYTFFGCCLKSQDYMQPSGFPIMKSTGRPSSKMNTKNGRISYPGKGKGDDDQYYDIDPVEVDMDLTVKEYPINVVFILGEKKKIVAKITIARVTKMTSVFDESRSSLMRMKGSLKGSTSSKNSEFEKEIDKKERGKTLKTKLSSQAKKEIFSKYDKGIKCEAWEEVTPEKISQHIAMRIKCDTIMDALCGLGSNTIQFAKICNYVIANDINMTKTLWAKHNTKVYKVDHKVDFLNSDFMTLRKISADVVFLDPSVDRSSQTDKFSLFKHIKPDPLTLLAKSLEISYKLVLQLPGDTEFEELPQLIHQSLEKYGSYSKRYCIEIEKIVNARDEVERIIVYFGDCSAITLKQEYEAIYDYITRNETVEWKQRFPFRVITAVIEKVGIWRSFSFIAEIEDASNTNQKHHKSLFESFLETLVQKNVLNRLNLNGIIEEESFRGETFGASPHSLGTPGTLTTRCFPGNLDSASRRIDSLDEILETKEKLLKSAQPYFADNIGKHGTSLLTTKLLKNFSSPPGLNKKKDSPPHTPLLNENYGVMRNSYDMSELAVSSYSVTSSYLKDSSDDEGQSRRTLVDFGPEYINDSSLKVPGDNLIYSNALTGQNLPKRKLRDRITTYSVPKEDQTEMMLVVDKQNQRLSRKTESGLNGIYVKTEKSRNKQIGEGAISVVSGTNDRDFGYNQSFKFESDEENN